MSLLTGMAEEGRDEDIVQDATATLALRISRMGPHASAATCDHIVLFVLFPPQPPQPETSRPIEPRRRLSLRSTDATGGKPMLDNLGVDDSESPAISLVPAGVGWEEVRNHIKIGHDPLL